MDYKGTVVDRALLRWRLLMPHRILLRQQLEAATNPRLLTIGDKLQVLVLKRPESAKVIEQMLDRLLDGLTRDRASMSYE